MGRSKGFSYYIKISNRHCPGNTFQLKSVPYTVNDTTFEGENFSGFVDFKYKIFHYIMSEPNKILVEIEYIRIIIS